MGLFCGLAKVNPLLLHLSMLKGVQIIQMELNYSYTHNLSPTIENSEVKKVNHIEKGYNAKK